LDRIGRIYGIPGIPILKIPFIPSLIPGIFDRINTMDRIESGAIVSILTILSKKIGVSVLVSPEIPLAGRIGKE